MKLLYDFNTKHFITFIYLPSKCHRRIGRSPLIQSHTYSRIVKRAYVTTLLSPIEINSIIYTEPFDACVIRYTYLPKPAKPKSVSYILKVPKKGTRVLTQNWFVSASDLLGTGCKNCWIIATIHWLGCDATTKWDITSQSSQYGRFFFKMSYLI